MKIAAMHSHQNGWEFIKVHKPALWTEIERIVKGVDATKCRTKVSKEKRTKDKLLYSPIAMNERMKAGFGGKRWKEQRTSYWVTEDATLIRRTMHMPAAEQKKAIDGEGRRPIFSYNQTDFVKDRVAVEVQFGKYSFVAYDLFVKHMAFYIGNVIDVGVEILAMKSLQEEMASGVPAVPLVLIGVAL